MCPSLGGRSGGEILCAHPTYYKGASEGGPEGRFYVPTRLTIKEPWIGGRSGGAILCTHPTYYKGALDRREVWRGDSLYSRV